MLESLLPDSNMAAQHQKTTSNAKLGASMAMSARKLAATLWELQEISLLSSAVPSKLANEGSDLQPPETPAGKRNASQLPFAASPASSHVTMRALRRSSVKCRIGDGTKKKPSKTGQAAATTAHMQVLKLLENARPMDVGEDEEGTQEIDVDDGKATDTLNDVKAASGGNRGSTTSSDLLKVLNRVWALEEQHNSSTSVVNTLQSDLEEARKQVKNLTVQQMSHYRDMENLSKQLTEEKAEWKEKEQENTKKALQALQEELDEEKKLKRKLDLVHRKVTKELIDVKKTLMKALQDLEREQKARELMEDVCDELAREVGEDKARVEALKRESMKVREEVEEERKMLQVAEVWREERVQMKLAEARLEIEEKNTALDKLRIELDSFLKAKRACDSFEGAGAGSGKINSNSEMSNTQSVGIEKQPSCTLGGLLNEAYEGVDEHRAPDNSLYVVEIKGTIPKTDLVKGRSNEYHFESSDDDDSDSDVDKDEDLHSIEFDKEFKVEKDSDVGEVKGIYSTQINDADYKKDTDSRHCVVDLATSPGAKKTMKQGGMQGLETTISTQAKASESNEENRSRVKMWNFELEGNEDSRDRVKMWNFELDSPWKTKAKSENADMPVLSENANNACEIKSNLKGQEALPLSKTEPRGETFISSERERKNSGLSETNGITPGEPSQSLSLDAVTNGVWSLQDFGSSRELKGVCASASSSAQQCRSPTRNWDQGLSSPDPVKQQNALSAKPAKALLVGGTKATKEKNVKGKTAEAKADTKQPRLRMCKAL